MSQSVASGSDQAAGFDCTQYLRVTGDGIWAGDDPLTLALPLFIIQLTIFIATSRIIDLLLRPFRQPRLISQIIAGFILGPSVAGVFFPMFKARVLPDPSQSLVETFANIGVIFWLFLVGMELDLAALLKSVGRKAVVVAAAGILPPCSVALVAYFLIRETILDSIKDGMLVVFLGGILLSVSSFPVLAQIVAELKLLQTEIGSLSLSSAIVNDIIMWTMVIVIGGLATEKVSSLSPLWVILCGLAFVLFLYYVARPAMRWVSLRTPEGEGVNEMYVNLILAATMGFAFTTDAIGLRPAFGAFAFGLVIPDGPLSRALIEKLEDFTFGLFLPLFFITTGLKINIHFITSGAWVLCLIIATSALTKTLATLAVGMLYGMSLRDGFLLSLLTNTKGVVDVVVLVQLYDKSAISYESYSIMMLTSVVMTALVEPTVAFMYRRAAPVIPYKHRTVQRTKVDTELRILACVYNMHSVPTVINLLEASNAPRKSSLAVFALRLVQLTGRASMLIVHDLRSKTNHQPKRHDENDRIIAAFEDYQQSSGVQVQALTSISPYSTMHEDICSVAAQKRIALIILPFHRDLTVLTINEANSAAMRSINQQVLASAPCSVGVLIDRGLSGTTGTSYAHMSHQIALLFFGGPDDREALCYALRMAEHEGVSLTVLRFIIGESSKQPPSTPLHQRRTPELQLEATQRSSPLTDDEKEKQKDEELLKDFRLRTISDNSVMYSEIVVCDGDETVNAIRGIDRRHDLFIVGRNQGLWDSPVASGLTHWTDCPELGPIGDLLASPDFISVSVLVVQQYLGALAGEDAFTAQVQQFIGTTGTQSVGQLIGASSSFGRPNSSMDHLIQHHENE
ncbi:cation/H(+) antiporter 15-like [Nymphaea colorata]|nr:cation/H(+) antiporter 15-like [Nymphaea colorata]